MNGKKIAGIIASSVVAFCCYAEPNWEILENSRLHGNASNDGDSFHVVHDGREYIFRLYFVDCPESSDQVPERVREQAAYWDIDPSEVINFGHEAAQYTRKILNGKTFTVSTRWEDARGQSSLPRHYAFIDVDGEDLAQLLVENGYGRVYGQMVDRPDGLNSGYIASKLDRLQQTAKSQKTGIWSKSHDTSLASVPIEWNEGGTASTFGMGEEAFDKMAEEDYSVPTNYPVVVCSNRVPVYKVREPFQPIGFFNAGTEVQFIRYINDSMVHVKYIAPSGKVSHVSCKYWELGLEPPPTNEAPGS